MDYQLDQLRAALAAGGVKGINAVGIPGGFTVQVITREGAAVLMSRRQVRRFASLDTLAAFLRAEGVTRWQVIADQWEPRQRALAPSRQPAQTQEIET